MRCDSLDQAMTKSSWEANRIIFFDGLKKESKERALSGSREETALKISVALGIAVSLSFVAAVIVDGMH